SRLPNLFRGTQLPTDACLHLVCCHTRIEGDQLHLPIRVVEVEKRHIRDHQLRSTALQAQPAARSRDVTGTVTKSRRSTKERWFKRKRWKTRRALIAISAAPPLPGSRTLGRL